MPLKFQKSNGKTLKSKCINSNWSNYKKSNWEKRQTELNVCMRLKRRLVKQKTITKWQKNKLHRFFCVSHHIEIATSARVNAWNCCCTTMFGVRCCTHARTLAWIINFFIIQHSFCYFKSDAINEYQHFNSQIYSSCCFDSGNWKRSTKREWANSRQWNA